MVLAKSDWLTLEVLVFMAAQWGDCFYLDNTIYPSLMQFSFSANLPCQEPAIRHTEQAIHMNFSEVLLGKNKQKQIGREKGSGREGEEQGQRDTAGRRGHGTSLLLSESHPLVALGIIVS